MAVTRSCQNGTACAVQDLADSKRINSNIQRLQSGQTPQAAADQATAAVSATIVSGLFWPSLQEDSLKLPQAVSIRSKPLLCCTRSYSVLLARCLRNEQGRFAPVSHSGNVGHTASCLPPNTIACARCPDAVPPSCHAVPTCTLHRYLTAYCNPLQVEASLTTYAQSYNTLKTPRKLQWKRNLGTVELDVTVGSRTLRLSVAPAQASLVLHFSNQTMWSLVKLAQLMGLPAPAVRSIALFWVAQGAHDGCINQRGYKGILHAYAAAWPAPLPNRSCFIAALC